MRRKQFISKSKQIKEKARERFFKLLDKSWEKNKDVNPKKIENIVSKAVEEVRRLNTFWTISGRFFCILRNSNETS